MDLALQDLGELIADALPQETLAVEVKLDELIVTVRRDAIVKVLTFLRDDVKCQFRQLMDVCGVDYPGRDDRFEVVYNLLSLTHNIRLRIKVLTDENTPVPSVTGVFSSADWFEREAWDMYGIAFSGHPDLRRILTDYGFEGHPLRKDFPLTGFTEVRYDDQQKRVVHQPVDLPQEFRNFDFMSPWEGVQRSLSDGDEADRTDEEGG